MPRHPLPRAARSVSLAPQAHCHPVVGASSHGTVQGGPLASGRPGWTAWDRRRRAPLTWRSDAPPRRPQELCSATHPDKHAGDKAHKGEPPRSAWRGCRDWLEAWVAWCALPANRSGSPAPSRVPTAAAHGPCDAPCLLVAPAMPVWPGGGVGMQGRHCPAPAPDRGRRRLPPFADKLAQTKLREREIKEASKMERDKQKQEKEEVGCRGTGQPGCLQAAGDGRGPAGPRTPPPPHTHTHTHCRASPATLERACRPAGSPGSRCCVPHGPRPQPPGLQEDSQG